MVKVLIGKNTTVQLLAIQETPFGKKELALVFKGVLENLNSDVSIYDCINETSTEGDTIM